MESGALFYIGLKVITRIEHGMFVLMNMNLNV